ncbi:NADPH-dependent conjugated polyketone reductase C2 [[Candida] anglica]|uniref:NADPH-dependent conjugated polyketone reductase C2 n=1 Tax=[Candida] anglica TaxID=148631 RepID=A0ABP0EIM8_9ASCO
MYRFISSFKATQQLTRTQYLKMTNAFTTKSGKPLNIGTGTGTKWQWAKKGRPEDEQNEVHQDLVDQISLAIKTGFRHIDTAETYTTHPEVAAAVKVSGIPREDLWITTKYIPGSKVIGSTASSKGPIDTIDQALTTLDTEYLDLFLLHTPFFDPELSHGLTITSAWKEAIQAKKDGKVRHIGVSNFAIPHLEETYEAAEGNKEYYPEFNQLEFHPYLQNQSKDIIKYCQDNNILVEAFGPLTPLFRIKEGEKEVTDHPLTKLLPKLSEKYGKTDAQILLRYTLQKGILPITTSSKEQRIRESLEAYDFKLDEEDVKLIDDEGATYKFRGFFGKNYEQYE